MNILEVLGNKEGQQPMTCNITHDDLAISGILNLEELERKACKTIEFPRLAVTTGNAIALFTMLVLQEIIEQQTVSPISNLANIIALSNSIASLNSSIKLIQ